MKFWCFEMKNAKLTKMGPIFTGYGLSSNFHWFPGSLTERLTGEFIKLIFATPCMYGERHDVRTTKDGTQCQGHNLWYCFDQSHFIENRAGKCLL